MEQKKTALVIGATGGIGGEVARALQAGGWAVRALHREPGRARASNPALEWVAGDALDAASVVRAAAGVEVVVHGANPPGYRNWKGLALPMLESSIAAAAAGGARLLLPGTVYNYGPDVGAVVDEAAPQRPTTRKGAIRVAMEDRLREAGVKTLIVRAGDFFGPRTGNSWLAQGMLPTPGPVKRVFNPARAGVGHAWAYLPDLAATMVRLLAREGALDRVEVFHFGGHWVDDNRAFAEAIRRAAGRPRAPIYPFPWPVVHALAPFNETLREMREMIYLWRRPLRLADTKLRGFLGTVPETPLDQALRATLEGLGRR
ncbi:NAD(P)H-binding protein [Sphingomonas desiccabilis]|uniref:NAD-dependent epimerase/dehydratase family protein n=1 Tax=Sphingomonas desiccabilis TaxID=429134 RepID=A0A4Q2IMJ8_9SPHN|nr:NAD(P)H-binding protein [Sphingomonas desiccabilis]MBB3912406.1 nucleoside-diphosphate-sugar epimerase [Sphingomonas desiccabilis]RXZ30533.1 NAD-dependent epimerase/dehydratase family protein [Sphingomonas desiccabilis]